MTRLPVNVFIGEALMSRPSPLVVSMPVSRISLPVIVQPVAPAARRTPATRPNPIRLDRTVPFLPPPEYTPAWPRWRKPGSVNDVALDPSTLFSISAPRKASTRTSAWSAALPKP